MIRQGPSSEGLAPSGPRRLVGLVFTAGLIGNEYEAFRIPDCEASVDFPWSWRDRALDWTVTA